MLSHAFRFVRSVVFLVSPENVRSQRAVEKIGGVRVGSRPDATGQESIAYRIDSSELRNVAEGSLPSSRRGKARILSNRQKGRRR